MSVDRVVDEHRRTAARWRTTEASSPLAAYARTGDIGPGIDQEIGERIAVARRGGLDHIGVDSAEEVEDLQALLEHVRPELVKGRARDLGRELGTKAAARWQTLAIGGVITPTSDAMRQFRQQVLDGDAEVIELLPLPPADFTSHDLMASSGWPEPDRSDSRAHGQWAAEQPQVWDAYEIAYYDALQDSISRWARTELSSIADRLDQAESTRAAGKASERASAPRSLKVRIIDAEALSTPTLEAIQRYLTARGWHRDLSGGSRPDIWALHTPEGEFEVLVPWSREVGDYPQRVSDLLQTVAAAEHRSELDVFSELNPTSLSQRLPVLADASEVLRQLAEARREYAAPPASREDRSILSHEAGALEAVADVLAGRTRWLDLVGSYAPSWRWHEFGEHNPELTFPWTNGQPEAAAGRTEATLQASGPRPTRPYIRPVGDDQSTPSGWVVEPVGRWRGVESEVVYDRRRFDVTVSGRSRAAWDDRYVAGLRAGGWEQHTTDGSAVLWTLDRVTSARNELARFDQRAEDVGVDPPDVTTQPHSPEVGL